MDFLLISKVHFSTQKSIMILHVVVFDVISLLLATTVIFLAMGCTVLFFV